ncbi:uncharacterized protein METZ01_LOCUS434511, partial [marine metagenome]
VESLDQLINATGAANLTLGHVVMVGVCLTLIYLAIKRGFEP